jgi:nucleotide-binding universal stress UspA family protein
MEAVVIIPSILCAVDLSPESSKVLRAALSFARREQAALDVLYVIDPLCIGPAARDGGTVDALERAADRNLHNLIARVARDMRITPRLVQRRLRIGLPDREILAAAAQNDARLIVIGAGARGRAGHSHFGSTGAGVVAQTAAPVLVISGAAADPGLSRASALQCIRRVVVAVDFTTTCMKATSAAAAFALRWHLPLTLLHAVPAEPVSGPCRGVHEAEQARRLARAQYELDLLERELSRDGTVVTALAMGGPAADVITRVAEDEPGTLIVVGINLRHQLMPREGSTLHRLLGATAAPLLILPESTARAASRLVASARPADRLKLRNIPHRR